ncbi:MAG: hypothetical protein WEA61_02595 [Anaerolineales bacterium]
MKKRPVRQEYLWVLAFAAGLVLLTGIPYLIADSNSEAVFTGFIYGVEDGNSYIAKMLAGAQGDWLFRSPYTTAEQGGVPVYLPYLLLGKLFGPDVTHNQLVWLFHIFRSLSLIAVCLATYEFLALFLQSVKLRRLGLTLAALGSGLGWVMLVFRVPNLLGSIPLDFYSPETFGFLANFTIPHLVLARALLLWGLQRYLRPHTIWHQPWLTMLIWFALALCHPITAALGVGLIIAHQSFRLIALWAKNRKKRIEVPDNLHKAVWPILGAAPLLLVNGWLYVSDSYLRAWAAQNQILSPNVFHYILAYGWVLPFVYLGIRAMLARQPAKAEFLLVWSVLLPILIYAPIGLQRRLAEGAWVMLIVLSLYAFDQGLMAMRRRELLVFSLAFPGTLVLLLGALQLASTASTPIFRATDEVTAFEELRGLAPPGEVVLASYETGNALPAWAPLRVVVGHGPESVGLDKLWPRLQAFYQGRTSDDVRLELLQQYGVDYVFWGPSEQGFGSWLPYEEDYLELVVQVGDYGIYRVLADEAFD